MIKVVSKPRITPEGKAQADSKAQQPRQVVSISSGLQHRHRGSDGVMKLLLILYRHATALAWGKFSDSGELWFDAPKRKRTGPSDPVLLSSASPDAVLFVGKSSQTVWWKPARKDARTPEKPNL